MKARAVTKRLLFPSRNASPEIAFAGVRERLLREAVRLFARSGFDGVAVDEIVNAAGVNKRMLYHYFGSKEGIYAEVLQRVYGDLAALESALLPVASPGATPTERLRRMVYVYFSFLQENPAFVKLLLWENLSEGRRLERIKGAVSKTPMLRLIRQLLREGAASGEFRDRLNPKYVLISLIGLCLIYFSNRHTLSHTVGLDLGSPAVMKRAANHTAELLVKGLTTI